MTARFRPFAGAAEPDGAAYLLELAGGSLLLDCGDLRGVGWIDALPPLDTCWLGHAHLDHVRALPELKGRFPTLDVVASRPTVDLAEWTLKTRRGLDAERAAAIAAGIDSIRDRRRFEVGGTTLRPFRAGHALGARMLHVELPGGDGDPRGLLYTGDFCCHDQSLIWGAEFPAEGSNLSVDVLVMEGMLATDRRADSVSYDGQRQSLSSWVGDVDGGRLIVASPFGEAPEVVAALRSQVDSCAIHCDLVPPLEAYADHCSTFSGDGWRAVETEAAAGRLEAGGVVVAPGDRLHPGSPAAELAREVIVRPDAGLAFVNPSEATETPARRLRDAARGDPVDLPHGEQTLRARVDEFVLSTHAPRWGLVETVRALSPTKTILVHGYRSRLHALRRAILERTDVDDVSVPEIGDAVAVG
ncbi:MAG: MBL fold metallo-hydrolase RNA specificity domain-containing protein [Bradymonadaceae bacterium]